jgi:L-asparagine transporter-like permease
MEFIKSASQIYGETSKVGKMIMVVGVIIMIVMGVAGVVYAAKHPSL